MTIYEELVQKVSGGETFYIDFEKRIIKIGKNFLVKNGEYDTSKRLFHKEDDAFLPIDLLLGSINVLYASYKYSLPSERSDKKRRTYFKALSMDEIPDCRLMAAERREIAQAKLEGFILCMILENRFVWDEKVMGKWFWQSKGYDDLVILRKWIENN